MRKDISSAMSIDKRVVERNIKRGVLTREEYDKHLAGLPDVADQAEVIRARLDDESADEDEGGEEEFDEAEG